MVRLGLNSAVQSDGKVSSQMQPRAQTRSSLTDRDTHSFSDFKHKWMSERSTSQGNRLDRSVGQVSSILQRKDGTQWPNRGRSETTGVESALSRLRDIRQQRDSPAGCYAGNRIGLGQSSRSNSSITERLTHSPFGIGQPMFQRHRTAASQLREIKQIARDGSIVTKMSQSSVARQERSSMMRSRAGSGSSSESFLKTRQKTTEEIDEHVTIRQGKENKHDESDESMMSILGRLRRQRVAGGGTSQGQQTLVEQKLAQARQIIGSKGSKTGRDPLGTEKTSEENTLRQKSQKDVTSTNHDINPSEAHNHEVTKTETVDVEKQKGTVSEATSHDADDRVSNNTLDNDNIADNVEVIETAESEVVNKESIELQGQSFERSRLIASRIFEKLESKKCSEKSTRVGRKWKMESEVCTSNKTDEASDDLEEKGDERLEGKEQNTIRKHEDLFEVNITRTKPINIPGLDQIQKKDGMEEATENIPAGAEELGTERVDVRKIRAVVEMSLKESEAKILPPSLRRSPVVPPKPSPPVAQKPPLNTSIVLGSGEMIRVSVEQPEEERNNEEDETEERGDSSIEEPTQQSVATLRNSLFGGSSSSLEKMLSRGMGGTLSASPVVFRKKQVTERRQVVSSVEVTKNGLASVSMTKSYRMERKSETDVTRKADDAGLLPTLYTRFEKPKKPGTAPRTRKIGFEPVTLSVKLSDDGNDSD